MVRLAIRAGATVVPVFFHGTNSRVFHAAGRLNPRLCSSPLLIRELLRMRGRTIRADIGEPIPADQLARIAGWPAKTAYVRARTYGVRPASNEGLTGVRPQAAHQQLAAPESSGEMEAEIAALDESQQLLKSGAFTVCIAPASKLPQTLSEIGRLREVAFRAVGEGCGNERDLDRFDDHYQHVIVWNHERSEVVGSYRIGQTDEILPRLGVTGLYTSTLFRYRSSASRRTRSCPRSRPRVCEARVST